VAASRRFADDHNNQVLATHDVIKPAREQAGITGAGAPTNLVWLSKRLRNALAVFGQQVGVAPLNMLFALFGQLDFAT
jgi:hypothetical protein